MLLRLTKVWMIMSSKKCRCNHEGSNDVWELEAVYLKKLILAYYKIANFNSHLIRIDLPSPVLIAVLVFK